MKKENTIYGIRPLIEAIKAGKEVDKILFQNGLRGDTVYELKKLVSRENIPVQYVPIEKLNQKTSKNHQGVIAYLSSIEYQPIENIITSCFEEGKNPLILLLDRITDVRNFGAIGRTAECAGVNAIVIPARGGARINADAVKTSAGALNSIPVCRSMNLKNTIQYLKESGLHVISCTEKATMNYYDVNLTIPLVIIMGSEEDGVSGEYLRLSDEIVKIPLAGEIESLNVSVATGIVLFEALKQRKDYKI